MVQNACTRDSFSQIRQYIHFVDNMKILPKDHPRWDPLQKIQPILDLLLKQLALAYVLGDRLSIDEAMIKYCGKFVSFVQYMPKKPTKHGKKVFALCCAYTGYLYAYKVYTGRESAKDGSPKMVISRLLMMAGVATVVGNVRSLTGRILYTDNWYTGLDVIEYVYRLFGILMVGTVSLTTKLSRTTSDSIHKFTNSITSKVPRGWMRCAYQQIYVGGRLLYTLQATLWKDKKMVGFLHNHHVSTSDASEQYTVTRWSPRLKKKRKVPAHSVVTDYNDFMSGVDNNDKSIALWTVSLKSLRFYLRKFYWQFDSIINAMWILVCHTLSEMNESERKKDKWRQFSSKDSGRYDFTMSLGVSLIKRGLEMDWDGPPTDIKGRPAYTRKMNLVPCQCDGIQCFFCQYGHTHGIDHMKKGQKRKTQNSRLTAT